MGPEDGELALDQDLEAPMQINCVASPSAVPANPQDTVLVELFKSMQEQINTSNKLLIGLVNEQKQPTSRKRNISVVDSDNDLFYAESPQYGKVHELNCDNVSRLIRQQKPLVDDTFAGSNEGNPKNRREFKSPSW